MKKNVISQERIGSSLDVAPVSGSFLRSRHLCLCRGNNRTCLLRVLFSCREARPGVVMLSLAGDLAVAWHLADPAVQLRDYRPPRVAVTWSRLSPTHSWWPQTFAVQLWQTAKGLLFIFIFCIKPSWGARFTQGGMSRQFAAGNLSGTRRSRSFWLAAQLEQKPKQISKWGLWYRSSELPILTHINICHPSLLFFVWCDKIYI